MDQLDLATLLRRIKHDRCSASLRADGSARMLGQLQLLHLEEGLALHLTGAKHRDALPVPGTPVTVSFLLPEGVVAVHAVVLDQPPVQAGEPVHPVLRITWPERPFEFHRRDEVRVATPELPPLRATLVAGGRRFQAMLLNLTETGMGLALEQPLPFTLQGEVTVETELPGGVFLSLTGEVRYADCLEEDPLPVRFGLVLTERSPKARELLRDLVQARRIIRSEALREE
jgi:c-di-GMP-binding flagellar brake protein YcgR